MTKRLLAVVGHVGPEQIGETMTAPHALAALAALGQPTRLEIFRSLMRAEPAGVVAGALAEAIGCLPNTLSAHLSILARSGLVRGTRDGRSIVYHADSAAIKSLIGFLVNDCCGGHPELCDLQEAIRDARGGCKPAKRSTRRRS
jgi:ArsR family transcriptional regulator, arsenate/arsenite/antimonite-responsive transcriptional repressor